jgi:hypothetical protein
VLDEMSVLFNGTTTRVLWSKGSVVGTGAITFAMVVKFTGAGADWGGMLMLETNTPAQTLGVTRSGGVGQAIMSAINEGTVSGSGISFGSGQGWCLVVWSKPAGTNFASCTIYPLSGSPTSATAADTAMPNSAAWNNISFGSFLNSADFFPGNVAVLGIFDTNLNQADRESLASTFTRSNWLSKGSPVFLVDALDDFQTDYAGTSTRTSITGNSSSGDDPPGWATWAGPGLAPAIDIDYSSHLKIPVAGRRTV